MIFNITACGVKSNNTSKSPLRQTKDMAENVYDAIKNHDSEQLKEQFCERLQPGKETAVDKIYEYIDGEIETLETDFETDNYADTGGGENRGDKLSKGFSFGIYVVSDNGTRYEIVGKGDVINTIEQATNFEGSVIQKQLAEVRGGVSTSNPEQPKQEVKQEPKPKATPQKVEEDLDETCPF